MSAEIDERREMDEKREIANCKSVNCRFCKEN